jgi:SsrA-binding protein
LEEAYARIRNDELYLIGCHISPYPQATVKQHEPVHDRKLLLHRRQIRKWQKKVQERGLTIVPLLIYFNDKGLAKVEIALARGKAHRDKRQDIKARDTQRDMQRAMRRRR